MSDEMHIPPTERLADPIPHQVAQVAYVLPPSLRGATFRAMGTTIQVVLEPDRADEAERVRDLFATWEETLSRFRPESELSRLNARSGEAVSVSPLLFLVLQTALAAADATDGLFDPTLGRELAALGYDRSFELVAANQPASRYAVPRPHASWRDIVLDPSRRLVRVPTGVALDFGGIAKGMAVDAAIGMLTLRGVCRALVNAGGDLAVLGLPPDLPAWPLAIEDGISDVPRWPVSLRRGAIATSGIARRHWRQGDAERHHLLDPRTGLPATSALRSVSVSAATCAQAEVAAKVAFVLGGAGPAFLVERDLAGFFAREGGTVERVGGWPEA